MTAASQFENATRGEGRPKGRNSPTKRRSMRRGSCLGPRTGVRRRRRAQPPREADQKEEDDAEQREPSGRARLRRRQRCTVRVVRVRIGRFSVTCAHDPGCFSRSRRGVKGGARDETTNGTGDARKMGPPCRSARRDTCTDTRTYTRPDRSNPRPKGPFPRADALSGRSGRRCCGRRSPSRRSGW